MWHKRANAPKKIGRMSSCDAATDMSPAKQDRNLELEYSASLCRVIRSRGDLWGPLPQKRSVAAAENVLLLSGTNKFNPAERRQPAEKLAALVTRGISPDSMLSSAHTSSFSSCGTHTEQRSVSSSPESPLSIEKRSPSLPSSAEGGYPAVRRLPGIHRPEASLLSRGQSLKGTIAADPGHDVVKNSSINPTFKVCKNCNDMFEVEFAQMRLKQCTALMLCACQLLEQCYDEGDADMDELAARTWTNMGLLHSHSSQTKEAAESFSKALSFRIGNRDVVALASSHVNLGLALTDLHQFEAALKHTSIALKISLDALQLGPIHTWVDQHIPQGHEAHHLLKIAATSLLVQGTVYERLGHECMTSYRNAMLVVRKVSHGSGSLAEKIQQSYTAALQHELSQVTFTQDPMLFHSKLFRAETDQNKTTMSVLHQELVATSSGKSSRIFQVGTDVEFSGPAKIDDLRSGLPMQSRHLRVLAEACALTLQCSFRSKRARQKMACQPKLFPWQMTAAVTIQCALRGHLSRRYVVLLSQRRRLSSAMMLQACIQRNLYRAALLRRLASGVNAQWPTASLRCASTPPGQIIVPDPQNPASRARSIVAVAGFKTKAEQTIRHCTAVLAELKFSTDVIDTFSILINPDRGSVTISPEATVCADQFYQATLNVLLLTADDSQREDVREANSTFELLQDPQMYSGSFQQSGSAVKGRTDSRPVHRSDCATFLLSLGYSDEEVDTVMSCLEEPDLEFEDHIKLLQGLQCPRKQRKAAEAIQHDSSSTVTRDVFVEAMVVMLMQARAGRYLEEKRRRAEADMARYEPLHPLLHFARQKASVNLQSAWRCKLSRARFCRAMGRSYSCSRRETLVYLKLHRESLAFDILRNTKAQQLQCAYRSCAARKRLMRERLVRPMRLVTRMRWIQDRAAVAIQKWLLNDSVRIVRSMKRARACHMLQGNIRIFLARRRLRLQGQHVAANLIQIFWRLRASIRFLARLQSRTGAVIVVQTAIRGWLARRRANNARDALNLNIAVSSQATSFATAILSNAFSAFRARRCLEQLAFRNHVDRHVKPLLTRVVLGHLARRAVCALRLQHLRDLQDSHATRVQEAWRRHARRKNAVERHRSALILGAAVRRSQRMSLYRLWLSGDAAAECVQRAWRQRRSRKMAAAVRLVPFLQRTSAARLAPLFLVRVAETRAGLAPGSICLHCLLAVVNVHSCIPCNEDT